LHHILKTDLYPHTVNRSTSLAFSFRQVVTIYEPESICCVTIVCKTVRLLRATTGPSAFKLGRLTPDYDDNDDVTTGDDDGGNDKDS